MHKVPLRETPREKLMERPVESDVLVVQRPIPTKSSNNPRRKVEIPLNLPLVVTQNRGSVEAR